MKKKIKFYLLAGALAMTCFSFMHISSYAKENTGIVKSIFATDKSLEKALTLGKSKPKEVKEPVGVIEIEEGQTLTDTGFINTFITNEAWAGKLEYGTQTYSTSLSGLIIDNKYYDIQNDPSAIVNMLDYLRQDYESAVSVNYNIKDKTGGKKISYSFTGVKSTDNKDIYVYYHYSVNGKAANGQEITRGGYLGYKIKVKKKVPNVYTAHLVYDANGGAINGHNTFDDEKNRQYTKVEDGDVNIPIVDALPTRGGYKFAFWYEPDSYGLMKNVYNSQKAPLDTNTYKVAKGKNLTAYNMLASKPERTKTLKAVWDKEYTLSYDANGGDTKPNDQKGTFGVNIEDLSQHNANKSLTVQNAISKKGYVFKGWKDEQANKVYKANEEIILNYDQPNKKLVAVFEKVESSSGTPTQHEIHDAFTTEFVDQEGNVLQEAVIAEAKVDKKDFAGYKFVKEVKTLTGVKYVYAKIPTVNNDHKTVETTPKTADMSNISISFLSIIGSVFVIYIMKKKVNA